VTADRTFAWRDELPTLPAPRLELRQLTRADAPALFAVFGDPEVVRYWSSPALADLAAAERLAAEIHALFVSRTLFQWGVAWRDTGDVVGTCTLASLDEAHRRAEVGFAFRRDTWGRGVGREALEVLIRFSFETLHLHRLEADVDPDNARALRLLERLGFRREGQLRERWQLPGGPRDGVMLGLLRREFDPRGRLADIE
jgi:RimJ/RimL family protein N-acetyltransferase